MSTGARSAAPDTDPDVEADRRRDRRALTEFLLIVSEGRGRFAVYGETGREYIVDLLARSCSCPNHEHRGARCKHQRRVGHEIGDRELPEWFDPADVRDPRLRDALGLDDREADR